MKKVFLLVLLVAVGVAEAAFGQENQADGDILKVEVSGQRGIEFRSYAQLRKGLIAYREKSELAPNSELYFTLIPKSNRYSVDGLSMRLASDDKSIPISIDASGRFQLPYLELKSEDEFDLILNRAKGQFVIKPFVKSANLPEDVKRMGDLRLECEVRWAVERPDVSIVFSTFVKLFSSDNPCISKIIKVYFYQPTGVDSIYYDFLDKRHDVQVNSRDGYTVPLGKTEVSNDTWIYYSRTAKAAQKVGD